MSTREAIKARRKEKYDAARARETAAKKLQTAKSGTRNGSLQIANCRQPVQRKGEGLALLAEAFGLGFLSPPKPEEEEEDSAGPEDHDHGHDDGPPGQQ